MAKSFFFAIFSIGFLIAGALCGRLDAENNRLELSEAPRIIDHSFLSCVLLKQVAACSETCFLIGSIYGVPITSGMCSEHNVCTCDILPNDSLELYWGKRFDSDSRNVLGEIRKDETLSKKVLAVLKTPFQTYQETISALGPLLEEEQLKNLHPRDKDAENIFVADDQFKAVEEYVEKNVKPYRSVDGVEIKKHLIKVIQRSDDAFFNRISQEICRSRNEFLIKALNEYNKSRSIETSACSLKEDEGNLIRLIDVATVNKLTKLPNNDPIDKAIKVQSNEPSYQSDPSTKEEKLNSIARSSNVKDVWWKLRELKKSEVEKLKQGDKKWEVDGYYYVYLKKTRSGLSLTWDNKKHGVRVKIDNNYGGELTQEWVFPNTFIQLNRNMDGTKTKKWFFQNFSYEVTINSKGTILHLNREGREDKDLIKKYNQRIKTWCYENAYIVGKDNCIIY